MYDVKMNTEDLKYLKSYLATSSHDPPSIRFLLKKEQYLYP